jgi:hypothetical protein
VFDKSRRDCAFCNARAGLNSDKRLCAGRGGGICIGNAYPSHIIHITIPKNNDHRIKYHNEP